MKVSGKSANRAPAPATSATSFSSLSIVASRSNATGSAWTHATLTTPSMDSAYAFPGSRSLRERDRIPDADLTVVEDVSVQPRSVHERLDRARLRQGFEVGARLAELDPFALDLADPEPLAHELVDFDAAREHVATRRSGLDRDLSLLGDGVHRLRGNERHGPARRSVAAWPVVAVALEPTTGARLHAFDRSGKLAVLGGDEDRLDSTVHGPDLSRRTRRHLGTRSSRRHPPRDRAWPLRGAARRSEDCGPVRRASRPVRPAARERVAR